MDDDEIDNVLHESVDSDCHTHDDVSHHKGEKYSVIIGCCGKAKRSQLPLVKRNFQIDKGWLALGIPKWMHPKGSLFSHRNIYLFVCASTGNFGDDVGFNVETTNFYYFGISDGVSGNRKRGIDAKQFPLALTSTCKQFILKNQNDPEKLFDLLCKSHQFVEQSNIYGSSTVCLASLSKQKGELQTLNLGDSGYMIIRYDHTLFRYQS